MIKRINDFLVKTQKYTKTDNIYLVKYGSWLTLGQVISSVCSFLLALAFANFLSKETYGIYKYILSISGLLIIPTLGGIDTAITQAISRGYEGSFIKALKTKIRWGILGSLASMCLSGYYYFNNNITLTISFLIISAFLPIMDSFNLYSSLFNGKKLFDKQTKYFVFICFSTTISLITAIALTKNLFIIIFIYFFSYTLFRFIALIVCLKKFPLNKKEDSKTIPYGKHLTLISLISAATNYLDKILVFHYLGPVELAVYVFAILPPEQLKSFLKSAHALAMPKLSVKSEQEIKRTLLPQMFKFAIFIGFGIIIYILLAPLFYKIFFPQYIEAVFYSQIFAISLITAITILPNTALQAKMAKKQLYQLNIFSPIIQIILLFLLINLYGLLGIILARVIWRFINLFINYYLVRKI
ncbi:MAG: oligosaccharide flippase family protein [bacterium]